MAGSIPRCVYSMDPTVRVCQKSTTWKGSSFADVKGELRGRDETYELLDETVDDGRPLSHACLFSFRLNSTKIP